MFPLTTFLASSVSSLQEPSLVPKEVVEGTEAAKMADFYSLKRKKGM